MSRYTAQNFINVASRFADIRNFYEFKPSVLYSLARPSTPDEVVEKAAKKAESGESLTVAEIKRLRTGTMVSFCLAELSRLNAYSTTG